MSACLFLKATEKESKRGENSSSRGEKTHYINVSGGQAWVRKKKTIICIYILFFSSHSLANDDGQCVVQRLKEENERDGRKNTHLYINKYFLLS
jgi:hypothetical protein